ncbi:MAG: riboflavin synthase [Gemmatimonadetes bacterium]|nr:riboflavin synthase [Gemmatimonadota bacterium]
MFTGIIEEIGRIVAVESFANGARLRIACATVLDDLAVGDSVAVDGVCQTVVARSADGFEVEAIATTLSRTTLGGLRPGAPVNLERALSFGARLGGHLVQGHVDGTGTVRRVTPSGEHVKMDVEMPVIVADLTVLHGSLTINGVSLTVNGFPAARVAQVALIPYTWNHTSLRHVEPGTPVNLEADLIGRFVVHWLKRQQPAGVAR